MAGIGKRLLATTLVLTLGLFLLPLNSFAASTGQIKGKITHGETGEPVIGASVLVVGTTQGATTNLEGEFQVYRMDPGTYVLRISHVDFVTVEVTDVVVKIDETFEVNQGMTSKVTDLDEVITVKGVHDILDKFVSSSQVVISQEQIKSAPVQTVDNLLQQVAGVRTTAEGEVFVRGGRAGEVAYIVDGVPIGDPLGGGGGGQVGANLSLVSGSIAEIQIIKDGFDPEYGNALSGIVNIRSFTGDKNNTTLNLHYMTDDFGNQALNKYSRNMDYLRFTLSGPDPLLSNKILPSIGLNFLKDQEFTYFLYADVDKNDGVYQMQDYNTPTTVRDWPTMGFLGFDIPERLSNRYHFESNFRFRPRQNLKFILSYKNWHTKVTHFSQSYWEYRYSGLTAPIYSQDQSSLSLEITHSISREMNYEITLSYFDYDISDKPGDPNNPGKVLDPDDSYLEYEWETFTDNNGNGVYDAPEPLINLFPDTANYGNNFNGPGYTHGERNYYSTYQGGDRIPSNFRFNNNDMIDYYEGEPFLDLNGNGVWDEGDYLNDRNNNGVLDADRIPTVQVPRAEPYIDGDSAIGEPFTDLNSNFVYDEGIDIFFQSADENNQDLNHNGMYDGTDPMTWTPGVPFLDRDGDGIFDRPNNSYDPGEPYTDLNGNGKYDYGGTGTFLEPGTHNEGMLWSERSLRRLRAEFKVVRQMKKHEVKAGFFLAREELEYGEIERPYMAYNGRPDTLNAYSDRGLFRDFYEYTPITGAVYFRDKIEYGSMVASLGLRWDFFLQDTDELAGIMRSDDRGGLILGDRQQFAPRIGFSYPISDKAKVYFNYGHFFQLPQYYQMYRRNTTSADQNDVLGNPNLSYQKTIQYSFGIKYKLGESYSVDVEGYFKDEFDKINSGDVHEEYLIRQQYLNKDYGRSRGFELTLERRGGGRVNGSISYTYAFAYGKDSKSAEQFEDDLQSREPLTESPLTNDIRHSLKSAIMIAMPQTVKPRLFGIPIPNGWYLSIETIIESGKPFTPAANYPGLAGSTTDPETNSMRFPMTATFDVRFTKEFALAGLDWQAILWVENLFNRKNVVSVYTATGRADTQQNINGLILGGTDYDQNPYNWGYGRQIRFGLELSI